MCMRNTHLCSLPMFIDTTCTPTQMQVQIECKHFQRLGERGPQVDEGCATHVDEGGIVSAESPRAKKKYAHSLR